MFVASRNAYQAVAVAKVVVGKTSLLRSEEQCYGLRIEACADTCSSVFQPIQRVLYNSGSDGRCSDDERAIAHGVGHGRKDFRIFQQVGCANGRSRLAKCEIMGVHHAQTQKTEVAHGPSSRTD